MDPTPTHLDNLSWQEELNRLQAAAADYADYMTTNRRWFSHRVGKMLVSVQSR